MKLLFWLALLACLLPLTPWGGSLLHWIAPCALVTGILIAVTAGNPYLEPSKKVSRGLLQAAVVLLGFGVDLNVVLHAGREGLVFALASISAVFALGWLLRRWMGVRPLTGILVTTGTAICGGSAIAAMSSVLDAPQEDVSVSVGTVFLLNALALLAFPPLGHALGLSPAEFGVWSGIAIHDVSSVVGAATSFGGSALEVATAVKLSRVLYLVPIVLIAAFMAHKGATAKVKVPWFIGFFLLASFLRSYIPGAEDAASAIRLVAASAFAICLFLIGASITRDSLKAVGPRPILLGAALWLFISGMSLLAI